jgi:hypothetical protein
LEPAVRIEITIDTDGARTTVEHEFGLEIETEPFRGADGLSVRNTERPDLAKTAEGVALCAVQIHRLTL